MLKMLSRKHRHEECRRTRALMSDYLDDELDDPRLVEHHVRWCPNCRRMLANLRRTVGGLGRLENEPPG
jgi:predicted anti-sigma-YlaC factor YlaD